MNASPNLRTCTAEEWAEWVLETKQEQGVIMYTDAFLTASDVHKITEAYRIVGYKEGYKKGKKDGSGSTFNHFFRAEIPCQICRFNKMCGEHRTKCDIWLRWIGVK